MKKLIMNKDTKIGNAQIEAVKHYEKVLNSEFKKIFKRWMIVKNIKIELPVQNAGELTAHIIYDTPNHEKSINRAVSSFKKTIKNMTPIKNKSLRKQYYDKLHKKIGRMVKLNYKMVCFIRSSFTQGKTVGQLIKSCDNKIKLHKLEINHLKGKKLHQSSRKHLSSIKKRSKFLKEVKDFLLKVSQNSIEEINRNYARFQDLPKRSK